MAIEYKPQPINIELLRKVAKAPAPDRPREIRDDKGTGLVLRHEPTGRMNFYIQLNRSKRARPFGKRCDARRVLEGKPTLETVKVEARRLRAAFDDGEDIAAERRAAKAVPTLNAYIEDTYKAVAQDELDDGAGAVARLKACFAKDFGKTPLTEISKDRIAKWKAKRGKRVKPETVNKDIGTLRSALNRAVEFGIIKGNPLTRVKMAKTDRNKRVIRALSVDEKAKLVAALGARDAAKRKARASANQWRLKRGREPLPATSRFADVLTPAVITSLETGCRRGELFQLQWPQVDFKGKEIHLKGETTKSYLTRSVPMNATARATLRDWWMQCGQPRDGYVFTVDGKPVRNLKHSYQAVLKDAGIERLNDEGKRVVWHSLRHTFGSLLGAAGIDPETIRELMGHADLKTTSRYLHTDRERKAAAVERLVS